MTDDLQQAKAQCLNDLTTHLGDYAQQLTAIDPRLTAYVTDAISNDGSHCNLYEALGIRKEFRLMSSYDLNGEKVQMVIRAIEGVWEDGQHVKGGLQFDTPRGRKHVRLMPYQVWCLFGIYAFTTEADMERDYIEGMTDLLPSEFVKDGRVWDRRRLTTEAHIFQTRKSGKTEFGAAIDFVEACFLGPNNAQVLVCANSREQAKIAFKAVKQFAYAIDPTCTNKQGGKYFRVTTDEMSWQPGHKRTGEIKVMSAGGKTKDGLFASLVHADEHGQAENNRGRSDMQQLVNVCVGSMGPRREKLLLHTTTAGLSNDAPYRHQLEVVERTLLTELDHPLGEPCRTADDNWFAFLLQLDPWEMTYNLVELDNPELFKKVNRSIGVTVQPTWYRERLHEAAKDESVKKEVETKDFNIWQRARMAEWIRPDRIRPLQVPKRVTDCLYRDGWNVTVGMDFSLGDDLFAVGYLCFDTKPSPTMAGRWFADTIAWVLESTLKTSPNRELYEQWIADGWLKVCPGEVFDASLAINDMMTISDQGVNLVMFCYDPAQSKQPINTLKAWLQTLFLQRNPYIRPDELNKLLQQMVVPVAQTALNFNPVICHIEDMVKDGWIQFSQSPLWPWCFGNCRVELSRNDLRRVVKASANEKVDPVHALIDAAYGFDLQQSKII